MIVSCIIDYIYIYDSIIEVCAVFDEVRPVDADIHYQINAGTTCGYFYKLLAFKTSELLAFTSICRDVFKKIWQHFYFPS